MILVVCWILVWCISVVYVVVLLGGWCYCCCGLFGIVCVIGMVWCLDWYYFYCGLVVVVV